MMHFERPEEPTEFQELVREAQHAVAEAIRSGRSPGFDKNLWQRYKSNFAVAQYSKCAFCELPVTNHDSAVDHFAPKAEVWELSANAEDRGHEHQGGLPNVRGRKASRKASTGYWWLAYEWRNYLLVCSACNEKWKHCFFPVEAESRRWPPDPEVPENPLLLNPFDDPAPWRHFRFGKDGQMAAAPGSIQGQATMDTLGFDAFPEGTCRRESLRLQREELAQDAYYYARAFVQYSFKGKQKRAGFALETLCRLGGIKRAFAGMVRAIAEDVTGFTWDELMNLRPPDQDAPPGRDRAPS
jgi:hypothetical protein